MFHIPGGSIITIYVDDILIMSASKETTDYHVGMLEQALKITDFGEVDYILKIKVNRESDKQIILSQPKFIEDMIEVWNERL